MLRFPGFMKAMAVAAAVLAAGFRCPAQDSKSGSGWSADPQIAAALKQVSAQRIQATVEKLVSFYNRSTLSASDLDLLKADRGITAARLWIVSEFERYSKDCGGCLDVETYKTVQEPGERIPSPTEIVDVYAVLKGSDPVNAKRIVLVPDTTTRATAILWTRRAMRPAPMTTPAGRRSAWSARECWAR